MSKEKWVFEKDEMLIELVKSNRGLYDIQSKHYCDNHYKRTVWAEIERALEIPDAKIRWEQLRAQYRKSLKKQKTKSGQSAAKIPKWRFSDHMAFLNAYIANDKSRTDDDCDSDSIVEGNTQTTTATENNDDKEVEVTNRPVKKLITSVSKRITIGNSPVPPINIPPTSMAYILQKKEEVRPVPVPAVHTMDIFFSLMAETVKKFSPSDQHFVKTQVFNLVNQIEEKYLHPACSSYSSPPVQQSLMVSSPDQDIKPLNIPSYSYLSHMQDDYEEEKNVQE